MIIWVIRLFVCFEDLIREGSADLILCEIMSSLVCVVINSGFVMLNGRVRRIVLIDLGPIVIQGSQSPKPSS